MLPVFVAIAAIAAAIVLWIISTQRKLAAHDENIGGAMYQIGVQLSSRMDALMSVLELTKSCAAQESETLMEAIRSRRRLLTAASIPADVVRQEGIISEVLDGISIITEQNPQLKADPSYIKTMDAVQTFGNMLRTSYLIYNDSVTKLNRETRTFPVSLIAGMLGFRRRDYLVEQATEAEAILQAVRERARGNGQQKLEQHNQSIKMEEFRA